MPFCIDLYLNCNYLFQSFYRRSLKRGGEYFCEKGGNCSPTARGNNSCPACRLKRCRMVGMSPLGIFIFTDNALPFEVLVCVCTRFKTRCQQKKIRLLTCIHLSVQYRTLPNSDLLSVKWGQNWQKTLHLYVFLNVQCTIVVLYVTIFETNSCSHLALMHDHLKPP